MSVVRQRRALAELGLSVPDGRAAGRRLRAGRAQPATSSSPPARCRCATASWWPPARSAARSRSSQATECAQQCALNALAAVKARGRRPASVRRVVKVVVFVASTPDFTGQPGVANGASELLGAAFGDAGVARAQRRRRGRPCRSTRRSRSSSWSRSPDDAHPAARITAPAREGVGTGAGDAPATPRPSCWCATATEGLEAYLLRRQSTMEFAAGHVRVPRRQASRSPTGDVDDWVGPIRGGVGQALRLRRDHGARSRRRRGARDVRGVGRPARRPGRGARRRRHERRSTCGAARARGRGATASPSSSMLGAWCCAPTCSVRGRTGSPRRSSRGATTPGSSSPPCPEGQRVGELPGEADRALWCADRVCSAGSSRQGMMLPPTADHLPRVSDDLDGHDDPPRRRPSAGFTPIGPALVDVDGELFLEYAEQDDDGADEQSHVLLIETIRGGSASTFASNSPGGVINLISKTGEVEGGAAQFTEGTRLWREALRHGLWREAERQRALPCRRLLSLGRGPARYRLHRLQGRPDQAEHHEAVRKRLYPPARQISQRSLADFRALFLQPDRHQRRSRDRQPANFDIRKDLVLSPHIGPVATLDGKNELARFALANGMHPISKSVGLERSSSSAAGRSASAPATRRVRAISFAYSLYR